MAVAAAPSPATVTAEPRARVAGRLARVPKLAGLIVLLTIAVAIYADHLVLHDPIAIDPARGELPPAVLPEGRWEHPLGTDRKGRDILSRVVLDTFMLGQ